jgi:hypothetical protein
MNARFQRRSAAIPETSVDDPGGWAALLGLAGRACCCAAKPLVAVVMPPTVSRPQPVDLLLCGHHYRTSRAALSAAGVTVYDETGALIDTAAREYEFARPEPAGAVPPS